MYSEGFCCKERTILKCGRQKQGGVSKNRIFDRIKQSNMQKNRAFIRSFRINTSFWCGRKERSDGIARNERPGICPYRAEQRDTDDRNCAFSGAPRSDVINVVLCQRVCRCPSLVGQSILLSQNGSHPQFLSRKA